MTTIKLLSPASLGELKLKNRMILAPLTRCRASVGYVPQAMNALYYAQRASAGLIISEATQVARNGIGYAHTPGIYSQEQVEGWKKVTKAVHAKGGKIFLQLWHAGRVAHPSLLNGETPIAPSAITADALADLPDGQQPHVIPRELTLEEIPLIIEQFRQGAKNAIKAGFDGVEIHAGNGYLPDQFLQDNSNQREDKYGGSVTIKITSDFICPWCLVAETRLNKAIERLDINAEIERIWYPYELNPTMPEAGMERKIYRTQKFGSWKYSQQLDAKTIQATQNDAINFRYDLMEKTPNTLKAHRLTWMAASFNKATEMATRILNAYFTEGKDITDINTLAELAADVGIDEKKAESFLLTNEGTKEIRELERQAASRGIRSVPTIEIGKEIIVGGQPIEVFLAALRNTLEQLPKV